MKRDGREEPKRRGREAESLIEQPQKDKADTSQDIRQHCSNHF